MADYQKFIPFVKVDAVQRLVSGIVTAERPDKDLEVCDYAKSKPFYQAWSAEFVKATEGKSVGNLREMHQLSAVGVGKAIEFKDDEKEIVMTFKVVDEDAWIKVAEGVYTGFSQGGRKVEQYADPVNRRYQRYVAKPTEVSLVDNPCLPDARFAYIKADGSMEMRKFSHYQEPADSTERIATLEQEVELLKAAKTNGTTTSVVTGTSGNGTVTLQKEKKTKRVGGKDLTASDFAYVGDPDKTETWKFPIHDASHVRNALARWNQAKGIPASEKSKVRAKIVAAARRFGVEVSNEKDKAAAILASMRKTVRIYVNSHPGVVSRPLQQLDADLGKSLHAGAFELFQPLTKGMWEVSRMAGSLEELACLLYSVVCEQEWELDEDSQLPQMLADNIAAITNTFLAMCDEETRELLEQVQARVA